MPDGLDLADQMAFTSLRNIYSMYRKKTISREKAKAEKMLIIREWKQAKNILENYDEHIKFRSKQLKITELAMNDCRKNPTAENALRLCNVIDGLEKG